MKLTTEELFVRHSKADKPWLMQKSIICLHDIRSAYNVGAVFRNADAFGINKVFFLAIPLLQKITSKFLKQLLGLKSMFPGVTIHNGVLVLKS